MTCKRFVVPLIASLIGLFFIPPSAFCKGEESDKTLSPYFFVKSDEPGLDQLPLKSTSADVSISGVIAHVTVTQVYKNEGKNPLEAIYVFPASTRAAVHGMRMSIGERTIVARIQKREEARKAYEKAKTEGRSASLLEQQRPNVFQMNVANILPGDVIHVELTYTELLVPTNRTYEFVYPTVVGPRYAGKAGTPSSTGEPWVANPYLHEAEAPPYAFDIRVDLSAGLPIGHIACSSHKTTVAFQGMDRAAIRLEESDKSGGNRDFILKYRLAGGKIETGILLDEGEDENFFLLMLQPPKRVRTDQIPPREYIFVVDVSGSMRGFPLSVSKTLMRDLITTLRPTDRFNILFFAGGSRLMSESSLPATAKNLARGLALMDGQRGGGGTELLPALKRALSLPKTDRTSRTILVVTDGYVSVEEKTFDIIRNNLGEANLFAFGIGTSVNRHIIEGMARVGMGEPFIMTSQDEATAKAQEFRKLIASPVLTGISVFFNGFEAYDLEPPSIPDVLADRPVILSGKWRGVPKGTIQVRGESGEGSFSQDLDVARFEPKSPRQHGSLRYLWARNRLALLSDYNRLRKNDERIQEVTRLGLQYNLLTAYTSFAAIDSEIRLKDGKAVTIQQPLPLPQGVSDHAVGGLRRYKLAAAPEASKIMPAQWGNTVHEEIREEKEKVAPANEFELEHVKVTNGISKKDAWRILREQIQKLNGCFQKGILLHSGGLRKITYTLTVDSRGIVVGLKRIKGPDLPDSFENCIRKQLQMTRFSARPGRKSDLVTVTLTMK